MKTLSKLAFVAAAALLVSVAVQPAMAACGTSFLIPIPGPINNQGSCNFCYSDVPNLSGNAEGVFWSLGTGIPGDNQGDDSDGFDFQSGWAYGTAPLLGYYGAGDWYNYQRSFDTNWAAAGAIDGCVTNAGPNGSTCTCVLITDTDHQGNSFFGLFSDQSDASSGNFDFGSADRTLAPLPKARILNSVRNAGAVELTVGLEAVSGGLFQDPNCNCGPTGYRVRTQSVAQNAPAPSSRAVASWTDRTGVIPVGNNGAFTEACAGQNTDVYVAAQLVFADGFESPFVSVQTTKVACNPNLADPKPIERRPDRPLNRGKGVRGGR